MTVPEAKVSGPARVKQPGPRARGDFNSGQLNSTQIAAQLALESSSLGLCSIIVSEVKVNVMLRRWDKAQFGGEVGWRA